MDREIRVPVPVVLGLLLGLGIFAGIVLLDQRATRKKVPR